MKPLLLLLALTISTACDAPWAGPTVPDSGRSLSLATLAVQGLYANDEDIVASTSLAALRTKVISLVAREPRRTEAQLCPPASTQDLCWHQQVDRPGRLYLAVITPNLCNVDHKEAAAISGRTLYFIRWIGNPQRPCSAMMVLPNWRLFSASRADLPDSGTLKVRLQMQGATDRVAAESQVDLT